jgi:ABC-type multidrug transport system permease subunit
VKLIDIIWKEISLVKSQRIALLLIFLYPFLAIGILGSSFSGMDIQKMGNINVGVVNELQFESDMIDKVADINGINIIDYDDENLMRSAIRKKEILVGLKISGASPNTQARVDMVYDNSSLLSSKFFLEIAKGMVQRVTVEEAKEKLATIWSTISSFGNNLESELAQIDEFKAMLAESEESLDDLESKLNALDFSEIDSMLSQQGNTIENFDSRLSTFDQDLIRFKTSFNKFKTDYELLKQKSDEYYSSARLIPAQISGAVSSIDEILVTLNEIDSANPGNPAIEKAILDLGARRAQMLDWNNSITEMITLMEEINDEQSSINTTINETEEYFEELESASAEIRTALASSGQNISTVNEKLDVFKDAVDEVRELIADARKSKIEIESKLNTSDTLLSSFSVQLIEFSKINPEVIARPVIFYERGVFDVDPLGILVANATAIVLILTCLLLTSIGVILERNQNAALRMELSPTSKATFVTGKIIGQLIIAMVEAFIIFGVAFIAFGINILPFIFELTLATILISLAFISLGLLITFFTKNQSTAILLSLLLVIPMMFLSGVILPTEFMEPLMRGISGYMPLTVANNMLIGIIIRSVPLIEMVFEVVLLLLLIVVVLAMVLLKKETYRS